MKLLPVSYQSNLDIDSFVILYSEDIARCNETSVNLFKYISNRLHGYSLNYFEMGSYLYPSFTIFYCLDQTSVSYILISIDKIDRGEMLFRNSSP